MVLMIDNVDDGVVLSSPAGLNDDDVKMSSHLGLFDDDVYDDDYVDDVVTAPPNWSLWPNGQ